MGASRKSVVGSTSWCHLCGPPIPDCIVDPGHPLFGTVDHVVPISRKGQNILSNRRAAHRACNLKKGDRIGLTLAEAERLRLAMFRILVDMMNPLATQKQLTRARSRATRPSVPKDKKERVREFQMQWMRWADDGGCVV